MTHEPLWQPSDILNAETEGDAESPKRRGRIPQSAWPRILERYKAGATLSAIAREFDCTPSAISYIVRKAEAAGMTATEGEETPPAAPVIEKVEAPVAAPPVAAPVVEEAARPARRAPRPVVEASPAVQAPPAVATPRTEEAPVAPVPVAAAPDAPAAIPATDAPPAETPSREPTFTHDSGRNGDVPAARRFEGREGRPPRPEREGRFQGEPREPRPERGDRPEFRAEGRGERGDRGESRGQPGEPRRQLTANVPRFPQGGQPGPQRDRFGSDRQGGERQGGERQGRDRFEGGNRPPRDFERDRQPPAERANVDFAAAGEGPIDVVYPYRQQQRNPARLEAAETPTAPADERMDAAAKVCAEAYRAWKGQTGGGVQGLTDALHELRKVIARMEIEISASRKEEQRPIAFPSYRTNLPPPQQPRG